MHRRSCLPVLLSAGLFIGSTQAIAAITAVSEQGFVSEFTLLVKGAPADVYNALTREIHRWWDGQHTYSGVSENLSLNARAGGCFCEQLPDGGSVEHARVVFASPGNSLRLIGGFGPLQALSVSSVLTFALSPAANGRTQVQYRYAVGGYAPEGMSIYAGPVDQAMVGQLLRLQRFLENGSPEQKR
jgi:uncharacterized protein YndB with AHSA1/START domain